MDVRRYGSNYASDGARKYLKKNAQEAHEAIRPTDIGRFPSKLVGLIDEDSLKLYALIWSRTIACQMKPATIDQGGGGFSPVKLRTMLLGVEKKGKEEELHSTFSSRSQVSEIDDRGASNSDYCKDVDVVSILPECLTSTAIDSMDSIMVSDRRLKDHSIVNSRIRSSEDYSSDYDSGHDGMSVPSSSFFEFQKSKRATQRVPLASFSSAVSL